MKVIGLLVGMSWESTVPYYQAVNEAVRSRLYEELYVGRKTPAARESYLRIIDGLVARGAQGIVLGCTEISILVGPGDSAVPLFDTTRLHAEAAVARALEGA